MRKDTLSLQHTLLGVTKESTRRSLRPRVIHQLVHPVEDVGLLVLVEISNGCVFVNFDGAASSLFEVRLCLGMCKHIVAGRLVEDAAIVKRTLSQLILEFIADHVAHMGSIRSPLLKVKHLLVCVAPARDRQRPVITRGMLTARACQRRELVVVTILFQDLLRRLHSTRYEALGRAIVHVERLLSGVRRRWLVVLQAALAHLHHGVVGKLDLARFHPRNLSHGNSSRILLCRLSRSVLHIDDAYVLLLVG